MPTPQIQKIIQDEMIAHQSTPYLDDMLRSLEREKAKACDDAFYNGMRAGREGERRRQQWTLRKKRIQATTWNLYYFLGGALCGIVAGLWLTGVIRNWNP